VHQNLNGLWRPLDEWLLNQADLGSAYRKTYSGIRDSVRQKKSPSAAIWLAKYLLPDGSDFSQVFDCDYFNRRSISTANVSAASKLTKWPTPGSGLHSTSRPASVPLFIATFEESAQSFMPQTIVIGTAIGLS
jgi:hypothetical protein